MDNGSQTKGQIRELELPYNTTACGQRHALPNSSQINGVYFNTVVLLKRYSGQFALILRPCGRFLAYFILSIKQDVLVFTCIRLSTVSVYPVRPFVSSHLAFFLII